MAGKRGAGEGSIRQRANGRWEARLTVGTRPDGRPDSRSLYGATRAEAQRKLAELRRRQEQGTISSAKAERETVAAYLTRWLDVARATVRPSTADRYEQIVRLHLAPALGTRRLSALRPAEVQALYGRLLAAGQSPASVRKAHNVLHRALGQAVRWGEVPRNVADAVDPPATPARELHPPTAEQIGELLSAARTAGDPFTALWATAAYTGCRAGELEGLQWGDLRLDTDPATATIRRTLLGASHCVPSFGEPKTAKSRRTISLPAEAVAVLREHRQQQLAAHLRAGPDYQDHDLVFASHLGTPLLHRNVIRAFKAALRRAGLAEAVRFHDLRHAVATILRASNVDLKTVSERLGHSSIRVTGDLYTHAVPALDVDAASRLGKAIGGSSTQR